MAITGPLTSLMAWIALASTVLLVVSSPVRAAEDHLIVWDGNGVAFLFVASLVALLKAALWLLIIVVFAQAILSWVAPDGPAAGMLNALTFPVLRPIRRVLPPLGGTLDLSPLVVIVVAQLVQITLVPGLEGAVTHFFFG